MHLAGFVSRGTWQTDCPNLAHAPFTPPPPKVGDHAHLGKGLGGVTTQYPLSLLPLLLYLRREVEQLKPEMHVKCS